MQRARHLTTRARVALLAAILALLALLPWLMLHGHLAAALGLLTGLVLLACWLATHEWRVGRRPVAALLVVGAVATIATVGWYAARLNSRLDDISRVDNGALSKGERPDPAPVEAVNILLLGSDGRRAAPGQLDLAGQLASGTWVPDRFNSDSIMVLHLPASRKRAEVVSIPRDFYVPIVDAEGVTHPADKINQAFADYGPYGTLRTIETLADLRIDHLAIIDFQGFRDLTTAVGGVRVFVPETIVDTYQDVTWERGWTTLRGDRALQYVRTRHGLAQGDFDRARRQQNFLRALMAKVLADGTLGNPARLDATLAAITDNLTVDSAWSNQEIRGLVLSLRGLSMDKVRFVTLPLDHYETLPEVGAVNILDPVRARELFESLAQDRIARYLKRHPEDELQAPEDVS
ncbi:MAG: LCP family protein [Nocardioides sp.]